MNAIHIHRTVGAIEFKECLRCRLLFVAFVEIFKTLQMNVIYRALRCISHEMCVCSLSLLAF